MAGKEMALWRVCLARVVVVCRRTGWLLGSGPDQIVREVKMGGGEGESGSEAGQVRFVVEHSREEGRGTDPFGSRNQKGPRVPGGPVASMGGAWQVRDNWPRGADYGCR